MSDNGQKPPPARIDWRGADLRGVSMTGISLEHADLRACDLRGVNFTGSSLRYADLRRPIAGSEFPECEPLRRQDAGCRGAAGGFSRGGSAAGQSRRRRTLKAR